MALAYPVLLTTVAVSVATGLLIYVVPQVVTVFNNLGQKLPIPTRLLIFIADAVAAWGLVAAVLAIAGAAGFRVALRREPFRLAFDRFLLRVPLLGRVIRATETARATRTLATLTQSGVPLLEGLKLSAQTVTRLPIRQAFERAVVRVREGGALARALAESGELPPVAVKLIGSGERSGRLEEMLEQAARHQTREAETLIATGTAVLGPLVILLVGALVLFIVLAILLPIFDLNQLIK
jgi:general secretion pathway protein F